MTTNCLVSKLKSSVNNAELEVFNSFRIKVYKPGIIAVRTIDSPVDIKVIQYGDCVVRREGNCWVDEDTFRVDNNVDIIDITSGTYSGGYIDFVGNITKLCISVRPAFSSFTTCIFELQKDITYFAKYYLNMFCYTENYSFPYFIGEPRLSYIMPYLNNGDLEITSKIYELRNIYSNISMDINSTNYTHFAKLTNLTAIRGLTEIPENSILEGIAAAQVSQGRNSGNIKFSTISSLAYSGNIYFGSTMSDTSGVNPTETELEQGWCVRYS